VVDEAIRFRGFRRGDLVAHCCDDEPAFGAHEVGSIFELPTSIVAGRHVTVGERSDGVALVTMDMRVYARS
jgi:hypothetical protein